MLNNWWSNKLELIKGLSVQSFQHSLFWRLPQLHLSLFLSDLWPLTCLLSSCDWAECETLRRFHLKVSELSFLVLMLALNLSPDMVSMATAPLFLFLCPNFCWFGLRVRDWCCSGSKRLHGEKRTYQPGGIRELILVNCDLNKMCVDQQPAAV